MFVVDQRVSVWQGDGGRICIFACRLCAREQETLCNGDAGVEGGGWKVGMGCGGRNIQVKAVL